MKARTQLFLVLGTLFLFGCMAFAQSESNEVDITKGPVVERTGSTDATIAWSTNKASSTVVQYGTERSNLDKTAQAPWGGLTHRVTLKNLEPGKTYFYRVTSGQGQGSGTGAIAGIHEFKTEGSSSAGNSGSSSSGGSSDNAKNDLRITNGPVVERVTDTNATVAWSTDRPASSVVKYGTDKNSLDQTAQVPWGATTHRVELKNLKPGTQYYFSVHSAQGKNAPGDKEDTEPVAFTTKGTASGEQASNSNDDKNDFHITNGPVVEHVADTNATVAWSTDRPASSVVKFGTDKNNLSQTAQAPWGATTHRVQLKNLKPDTQYYFQVQSAQGKNAPGQRAQSEAIEFHTAAAGQSASAPKQ
jgi:phosphodiesterase/alkaline phosphatase D-like protein